MGKVQYLDLYKEGRFADLLEFGEASLRQKRKVLGLTQQQMAKKIGVHQSRISRIERGLSTPLDYSTAQRYVQCYRLSKEEADTFFQFIFGLSPEMAPPPPDLMKEVITDNLRMIHEIRIHGDSRLAANQAASTSSRLREIINLSHSPKLRQQFSKLLGQALYEQAWAYKETVSPSEVLVITSPIITELFTIANTCEDRELLGLANFHRASTFYMMGEYYGAITHLDRALEDLTDTNEKLGALRALAVSWAYLGDRKRFGQIQDNIKRIIEKGHWSDLDRVCQVLEGLARAQGFLGLEEAFDTLEESWNFFAQEHGHNSKAPFRNAQLIRSNLEVVKHLQRTNAKLIEDTGREGLRIVQEHGYARHEIIIKKLLEELLG